MRRQVFFRKSCAVHLLLFVLIFGFQSTSSGAPMKMRSNSVKLKSAGSLSSSSGNVVYDFIQQASSAIWISGSLGSIPTRSLPFNGSPDDNRGLVRHINNSVLEDGKLYDNVLQTHPRWEKGGAIYGNFSQVKIPTNAKFIAKMGFLQGANATDGVFFIVELIDPNTREKIILKNTEKKYNGKLEEVDSILKEDDLLSFI